MCDDVMITIIVIIIHFFFLIIIKIYNIKMYVYVKILSFYGHLNKKMQI